MFNRYTLIFLTGLLILASLMLLRTGDEQAILAQLEQLRELAGITEPETGIEQLARANGIADLFDETAVFDLTRAGHGRTEIAGRQELVRQIIALRSRLSSLEPDLQQVEVQVDGDTAQAELTGSALGSLTGHQDQFLEIHSGVVSYVRKNGDWLITGATHLRDERQAER